MSCANFQELLAGQGAATATDFTPANIDFPYDSDDELRLDIYNYEDQQWVNVPLATGATIDVGGAGDVFYAWETYLTNGQTGVRTILATASTTPALPEGGTASHPLAPANNNYPVQGGVGVNVRLYRQTSIEAGEMPAYFYPGASIRAQDLNDNFEALRKVVEESSCGTNNVTDATPQLDARYWNKVDLDDGGDTYTSTTAAAWPDNDTTIATTGAGDDRWLSIPGEGGTPIAAGDGIRIDAPAEINVDLAATSGLEFNGGDLRVDVNLGCEITADGLNTETTAASIVQNSGSNISPIIRVATTLGDTTTNNDLQITGGTNVTVTRNSNNQLTIASTAGGGGGGGDAEVLADVAALNTAADTANDGDLFLVLNSTNLNADADSGDNEEDVNDLPMTTADGAPQGGYADGIQVTVEWDNDNTRWQFIRWSVATPDNRYVLEQGDTMTGNLLFNDGTANTAINVDGSAVFNENGDDVDFRVEASGQENALFVDGTNGRVGINTNTPNQPLDVNGSIRTNATVSAASVVLSSLNGTCRLQTSNASENWTFDYPPAGPPEGTNWALVEREVPAGVQLTANMAWTQVALATDLDGRVATAGDTMTGNLQMDGASVIADNGENVPDADGNWDIQNSNVWQVANGRTIEFPDNTDAPIPGQTGVFVCAGTVAGWTDANGGTWEHPGGTAQAGDANGAIIPFYVQTATNIILGTQTVGS